MTPEPVATTSAAGPLAPLDSAVSRATGWLLSRQHEDGHWVFELEADATIPIRIHFAAALPRHDRCGARGAGRPLSACDAGRAWRLGALSRRRVRSELLGKGVFRAQGRGRPARRAAYGACPRGDPRRRRRQAVQCLHPHPPRIVGRGAVARGAGDAGRAAVAAGLVSVPPRQDLVLVARRRRAAGGADGQAAARQEPAQRLDRRAVSRAARQHRRLDRTADPFPRRQRLCRDRPDRARSRAVFPQEAPPARDRQGGCLARRAARTARTGSAGGSRRCSLR